MTDDKPDIPIITPEGEGEDCEVCTEGLKEYITEGFCECTDIPDECKAEAQDLADKLIKEQISDQEFAEKAVELAGRYPCHDSPGGADDRVED